MTGGTLAWGIAFAVLCVITGMLIGWPIGHARGLRHAAEDAEDAATAAIVAGWKGLPDEDAAPSPPWPDAPPQARPAMPRGRSSYQPGDFRSEASRTGPGKHRHPAGPRHAALPAAGYLPAPGPWDGTITVPAPAQLPPWDIRPPEPEPRTEVLEPTAADCLRPDTLTDTGWTRQMARQLTQEMDADIERMEQDMDAWIAEHITATDPVLKEITR